MTLIKRKKRRRIFFIILKEYKQENGEKRKSFCRVKEFLFFLFSLCCSLFLFFLMLLYDSWKDILHNNLEPFLFSKRVFRSFFILLNFLIYSSWIFFSFSFMIFFLQFLLRELRKKRWKWKSLSFFFLFFGRLNIDISYNSSFLIQFLHKLL